MEFIRWCNDNAGFFSAILSLIGILSGILAIIVSIRTARLPYKKAVKISAAFGFPIEPDRVDAVGKTDDRTLFVNAANTGNRNVYFSFLGLACKKNDNERNSWEIFYENSPCVMKSGLLQPAEVMTTKYFAASLKDRLESADANKIYLLAIDSEGRYYHKYFLTKDALIQKLSVATELKSRNGKGKKSRKTSFRRKKNKKTQ